MASTTHKVEEPAVTIVHASKTPFPTIELGAEYQSREYITKTVFVDGNIKFAIEDAVVQPVSSARNSKYGVKFITISLPNGFINYLTQTTESQFYRPITKAGSTWFNVEIVADFGGFRAIVGGNEIKVPMDVFSPGEGVGIVTRMLFNAYTSRPERGGPSYIRFRLHDAEIMSSVGVNLPSLPVRGVKTPSRLPARKRSASEDLSKASSSQTTGGQSRQGENYKVRTSASVNLPSLSVRGVNTPRLPGNSGTQAG
ncbi:hypothetical protein BDQ12DRAFT_729783 [Crucibulum laeve]|uniref:Uncharacterized protein n=1 Tax=Crucibulum laeve TaxID=68775 RepID=A0A5C3LR53_9AGAR|nr:hypothetical protein BDQ12DRAFT_729783 [Crucibulum laeve]